jgi:endonuclease/exonuclease/phosphatase (EEP) superfamily protein YafD
MAAFARGTLRSDGWLVRSREARSLLLEWDGPACPLKFLAADFTSRLEVHRDPQMRRLVAWIADLRPDLVAGDFNAPRRSLALSRLPPGYRHAYESAGSGWSYTWPVPVPVYAIDQWIHGPEVTPLDYRLESTTASDHRLQVFDFAMGHGAR